MMPGRTRMGLVRFVVPIAAVALCVSACGSAPTRSVMPTGATVPAHSFDQPPTARDVASGRFVRSAELDDGALTVAPASRDLRPSVSEQQASMLFRSDPVAAGSHSGVLLAYGLVSVRAGLGIDVTEAPAWLGLLWGGAVNCPSMASPPSTTTTTLAPQPTPGYRAVIIVDSQHVFDYRSRGSVCGFPASGPSASAASEMVSVPWQLVAVQATRVSIRYQAPSCLSPGNESVSLGGNVKTGQAVLTVEIAMPFDHPSCPESWRQTSTLTAPPQGPGAPPPPVYTHIGHGPTGPIGSFQPTT